MRASFVLPLLLCLGSVLSLTACGYKGPLTLPPRDAAAKPAPAQEKAVAPDHNSPRPPVTQ